MSLENLTYINLGFRAATSFGELDRIRLGQEVSHVLIKDAHDMLHSANLAIDITLRDKEAGKLFGMKDSCGNELSEYLLLFIDEFDRTKMSAGTKEEKIKIEHRFNEVLFHLKEAENCLDNLLLGNEVSSKSLEKTASIFKYVSNKCLTMYKVPSGCWPI
ncbi:hypothetical protein JXB27_00415 [Candidatus Woesearchaeota archaeon]|nr:hypothetical protein [Candidatus Woesearchaeota archaeon]